jgi:hypothetical protein
MLVILKLADLQSAINVDDRAGGEREVAVDQ